MFFLLVAVALAAGWIVRVLLGEARRRDRVDDAEDEAQARAEQALSRPGAAPDVPIEVESAASVEPRAMRDGCPYCGGTARVEEHVTELGHRVRRVNLKCGQCGRRSSRFLRIAKAVVN